MRKSEIIANILWMSLQVGLCGNLVSTQFEPRIKKCTKKLLGVILILPVVLFAGFFDLSIQVKLWPSWCCLIYLFLWAVLFYEGSAKMKVSFILLSNVACEWMTLWSLMAARTFQKYRNSMHAGAINAESMYMYALLLFCLLLFFWYFLMKKIMHSIIHFLGNHTSVFVLLGLVNIGLILPQLSKWMDDGVSKVDFLFCTMLMINAVCLINILLLYFSRLEEKNKNRVLEMTECSSRKITETYKAYCDDSAKNNHDIRRQLQLIKKYLENDQEDQALNYLDRLLGLKKSNNKFAVHSGNILIDMIISEYQEKMVEEDIKMNTRLNVPFCKFSDADLCIVLGNLLDNAIEAVMKCPRDMRQISLEIFCVKDFFCLSVENCCVKEPIVTKKGLQTSKKEAWKHGFGISNVKDIVGRYEGYVHINCSGETFRVDIRI